MRLQQIHCQRRPSNTFCSHGGRASACRYNFVRANTPVPLESAEGVASSAVQMALDMQARAIVCFTSSGRAAPLLAKYRPPMPVYVVSAEDHVVKACRTHSGLHGVPMAFEGREVRLESCDHLCRCDLGPCRHLSWERAIGASS